MGSVKAFSKTGPTHMMAKAGAAGSSPTKTIEIDWDNEEHRRCITACLVKGTYVLESERANSSEADDDDDSDKPLAPAWWESFHFRLFRELKCACGCALCKICRHIVEAKSPRFIYGAIFEYAPPVGSRRHPSAPSYVVAFRGTMRRDATTLGDVCLDLGILLNKHHNCVRFTHAREEVGKFLDDTGSCAAVWLAGHSLGASIALDVGRAIVMGANREVNMPTFLFNPPQVSPTALISDKLPITKTVVHTSSYILKQGLGKVLKPHKKNMDHHFEQLSPWAPNLYVHQRDIICKGFIDYFEQRERVRERLPSVAASGTTLSYRDMCRSVLGGQNDRPHLLPSAILWKNESPDGDAHELRQWWQPQGPELVLSHKSYEWPASTNKA
ncbi:hypothetical protein HU200_051429 [Digitaria exilis]|uniref:Fungal lipase-like domain-containing protein n=1 Tax=Digitaria exilis TaxID=1010633 RepID=A0A835EA24_9POAL|nr:hypothetical protein HU200_051429 [Digitaria exilis]CAB3454483.1 unnamed protein product [Digitaria exilis]